MTNIDEQIEDTLAHYGVKGMKWGVRRSRSGYIKPNATLSRRDRKEQQFLDDPVKVYGKVYARAASNIRKETRLLNEKYKGQNFKTDTPTRRAYYSEYSKMVAKQLNIAATSRVHPFTLKTIGMSPKKTLQIKFTFDVDKELRASYDIAKADTKEAIAKNKKSIKHSDDAELLIIDTISDEFGYVIDILEEDLMQVDDLVDDVLEHFGVKGMKWGVRRIRKDIRKITKAKVREARLNAKQTKPTHTEQKKKNDEMFLTDEELRGRINRLQMEKTYQQLTMPEKSKGKKLFEKIVVSQTEAIAKEVYKTAVKAIVENKIAAIKRDDKKKK